MIGSHNKDDLVNDILADMCGLIAKTIALIPPEHDDERLSACAFVLEARLFAGARAAGAPG